MMMLEFTKLVPKEPRGIVEGIEPRPGIDCWSLLRSWNRASGIRIPKSWIRFSPLSGRKGRKPL